MDNKNKLPIIHFDQVSKVYPGGIEALKNVSFVVDPGEFAFLVGPSGAGKSTVIRLLIKQELPSDGIIQFEDFTVNSIPRKLLSIYRQQLGIVFQDLKLIPSKTVVENIQFALEITKRNDKEVNETTNYLLDIVNLKGRAHLFPDELSGGEKQRVAIARALANDPKLFIADEPTGNLDPENAEEIMNILNTINQWGTTVIVVTHDNNIVDRMQKRVIRMNSGSIIADEKSGKYRPSEGKSSITDMIKSKAEQEKKQEKLKKVAGPDEVMLPKKKEVGTREEIKEEKQEKVEEQNDYMSFDLYIRKTDKKLAKKLNKLDMKDIENILDLTDEELMALGFNMKEIETFENLIQKYLETNGKS